MNKENLEMAHGLKHYTVKLWSFEHIFPETCCLTLQYLKNA